MVRISVYPNFFSRKKKRVRIVIMRTPEVIRSEAPQAFCCQSGYGDMA
jgi:hypothetical protein